MIFIIFKQVLVMFVLSLVGYIMFRTGKITNEGSKSIGNILVYLSLPCVIISGFLVENTKERVLALGVSAALALLVLILAMLVSRIVFGRHALNNFAGSFSNPGFFGAPIIVASFSDGAIFYIASFIAFLNLLQWTYGVMLLERSGEDGLLLKDEKGEKKTGGMKTVLDLLLRLVRAPFMIAILIGLFFFFTGLSMPSIFSKCVSFIANINTPLAMFTIGIYGAQTDLLGLMKKRKLYLLSAVRLILIPALVILLLSILPVSNTDMKLCILIAAACPVGSNIAVYSQLYNRDYCYAVETVVMSTLFSIVTIPLMVKLATMAFGL